MWIASNENFENLIPLLKDARKHDLGLLWALCDEAADTIEQLRAELAALREQGGAIPEGYVLMPILPNDAMLEVILNTHDVYGFAADLYAALIAAAQETNHD